MPKMLFTNAETRALFDGSVCTFEAFNDLMTDVACGRAIFDNDGVAVSNEKANDKIRKIMYSVLGIADGTKGRELRRAIRRHKVDVFEITEDVIENMLVTGWGANAFFNEFAEIKNGALGEANEFYTEDNVILTLSELAGSHHNIFRQKLGEGKRFALKTSWYGLTFSSLAS